MKVSFLKEAFKKVKGNKFFSFFFFILVSCSLWLSLTLNRVYETNISVRVYISDIPDAIKLVDGNVIELTARVKGSGTALFGYIFDDRVGVTVDYSDFVRRGGDLSMPVGVIRGQVEGALATSLSLLDFSSDSLNATVQRAAIKVPVVKSGWQIKAASGCKLVSVDCLPDSVVVTAFVDRLPLIDAVEVEPLLCDGLVRDSVYSLKVLPGMYTNVVPNKVNVCVKVSEYVEMTLPVAVAYEGFPNGVLKNLLPERLSVKFKVPEVYSSCVNSSNFSVVLLYEDYLKFFSGSGGSAALRNEFKVECNSPYVENVILLPPESSDFSFEFNFAKR